MSHSVLKIVGLLTVLITNKLVNAAECTADEDCIKLKDCFKQGQEEYKYLLNRDFQKLRSLKVCGLGKGTDSICCKVVTVIRVDVAQSEEKNSTEVTLENHPNIKLINHRKCGIILSDRITGGVEANVGQFPWMALLQYRSLVDNGTLEFLCGGSLISARYILTAAHCVNEKFTRGSMLISVRLGEHNKNTEIDCDDPEDETTCSTEPTQDVPVESIIAHKNFDPLKRINDIALVRLSKSPVFKNLQNIETICLPVDQSQLIESMISENPRMTIAGWGATQNKRSSDVLLTGIVPYVENKKCETSYANIPTSSKVKIHDSQLCAGGFNNTDSCRGDSGSPIMYPAKIFNKYRMFEYGIVSFGIQCDNEDKRVPGVYARVSSFMKWILDNMKE